MLSYLGTPCEIPVDACLEAAIARSRVLVVEGYLWELPGAAAAIGKVRGRGSWEASLQPLHCVLNAVACLPALLLATSAALQCLCCPSAVSAGSALRSLLSRVAVGLQ